jgi:hypothetical protein
MKYVKFECLNINEEDLRDLVIDKLEKEGFYDVMYMGDRGGSWIEGWREYKGRDEVVIELRIKIIEEEVENEDS